MMIVLKKLLLWVCFSGLCAVCFGGGVEFSDSNLKGAIEFKLGVEDPNESDLLGLIELDVSSSEITSLQGIEHAVNLQELDLSTNEISDIKPLKGLSELTDLNLGWNKISDVSALSDLKNLESLSLFLNPQLQDILPLSELVNLKELYLTLVNVKNIDTLANLVNLELLWFDADKIKDVSILKEMPNLKKINGKDIEEYFLQKSEMSIERIVFRALVGFLVFVYLSILVFRKVKGLKFRPFRSIFWLFKGIFVFLLAVLLAGGLWFHAPWKVFLLIGIILFGCTVMPKRYRKWVWIGYVIAIVCIAVWVFLPDNNEGWELCSVEGEVKAFNDKRSIPDEENAAIIYAPLTNDKDYNFMNNPLDPKFLDDATDEKTLKGFWKEEDHPILAEWMRQYEDDFSILMEASLLEKCRFESEADMFSWFNENYVLRNYCLLLIRQGNNDIGNGNFDVGLQEYRACIQIGNHLMQQPSTTGLLGGITTQTRVFRRYCDYIVNRKPCEEELKSIEEAILNIQFDWEKAWPYIIDLEKLSNKSALLALYEINEQGAIRFARGTEDQFQEHLSGFFDLADEEEDTYLERKVQKFGAILNWFWVPSTPGKASLVIDEAYDEFYEMGDPDYDWGVEANLWSFWDMKLNYKYMMEVYFLSSKKSSLEKIREVYERYLCHRKGCLLVVELVRFKNREGDWPDSLDELGVGDSDVLIDPFSGERFRYEKNEESFRLYGVGRDGVDDGGERESRSDGEISDDLLVWPEVTCN